MKVYLLEENGGDYEDRYSCVVDVFVSEELANNSKRQILKNIQKENAQRIFCGQCKLCSGIGIKEYKAREVRIKRRCDKAEPIFHDEHDGWVECANNTYYSGDIYGDPHYKIIEKELIGGEEVGLRDASELLVSETPEERDETIKEYEKARLKFRELLGDKY